MFDVKTVNKRYFGMKIGDTTLEVEPPKIKALKKLTTLSKSKGEDTMENLSEAIKMILRKNKNNINVSDDLVEELDLDEMNEILTAYFEWIANSKNSPN